MIYVTKKCRTCGYKVQNRSSTKTFYGSPLRKCENCGTHYFDKDYIEVALVGNTIYHHVFELLKGLIANAALSLVFTAFISNAFSKNEYFSTIFFGVFSTIFLLHAYLEFNKNRLLLKTEIEESLVRLENKQYLEFLKKNGYVIGQNSPYENKIKEISSNNRMQTKNITKFEESLVDKNDNIDNKELNQNPNDKPVLLVDNFSKTDVSNIVIEKRDYRKLYDSLDPKFAKFIFPAGYDEFKIIINSLIYLFDHKFTSVELARIYAKNWTRTEQADADEVVRNIKLSKELEGNEDKIDSLVSFILIHKNNTDFEIKDSETFTIVKKVADSFEERAKLKEINNLKITQNINDDDYGKVVNKPIYINGFKRSDQFMKSLRFENGDSLKYERKGSIQSDGGNVDVYEIENENTHKKDIIYINLYSNNREYYPPKGYKLVSNKENDIKNANKREVNKKRKNQFQNKTEKQKQKK